MVVSQKVLDSLKEIGLNLYERKLFVALLARGTSTAGELAEIANVPRSRSYDVLETLASKGFLMVQNAKPLRYVAIEPVEAMERAQRKMQESITSTIDKIESMKSSDTILELQDLYKHGVNLVEPSEMTGSLRGRALMHNHMESMLKTAKEHIKIMTTEEGLGELIEKHYDILKNMSGNGVKIMIAAPSTDDEAVRSLKQIAEIREMKKPMARMCVVDGKEAIFALTDESTHHTQDLALWTKSKHAVSGLLAQYFDHVWDEL